MNLAMIDDLITREGGYTNNPNDAGGETNFGITVAVARANGYQGAMKDMPRVFAQSVYLKKYWQDPHFDQVSAIFPALAEKMFDIGVTEGVQEPVHYVQRALISLGYVCSDTGEWGNNDPNCLRHFLMDRSAAGQKVLLFMVAAQQSVAYMMDALKHPTQHRFEYGWQLNRSLFEVKL